MSGVEHWKSTQQRSTSMFAFPLLPDKSNRKELRAWTPKKKKIAFCKTCFIIYWVSGRPQDLRSISVKDAMLRTQRKNAMLFSPNMA